MSNVLEVPFVPIVIRLELAGLGDPKIWQDPEKPLPFRCTDEVMNAWGTRLRLRSLVAMGHNERRIGAAIGITREKVTAIVNGQVTEVTVRLAKDAAGSVGGVVGQGPADPDAHAEGVLPPGSREGCPAELVLPAGAR